MRTTTAEGTFNVPLVTSRMATPPPAPALDLHVADDAIGWIDGMALGFRGFGDADEAVHAAWVAYRTMSRHFARESGGRLLPIDTEPMSLDRSGEVELILAGGRPIATLVRPGPDSRSGPDSFGFELQLPRPADEPTTRATAYLVYRTLRRAGTRWAMWAPAAGAAATSSATGADDRAPAEATSSEAPPRAGADADSGDVPRDDIPALLAGIAVVLAVLTLMVLPAISTSTVVAFFGGGAILVAVAALASLAHLVVSDVRDAVRGRGRRTRSGARRGAHAHAAR